MNEGGVDDSIALQAGKGIGGQQNPLQTIGQFAVVQNALNSAKLFPLQQQQMQIANQRSGLGLQSDQSSLIQQQRQLGYASLAPLLAKKGPLTLDDVTSGLAGFEKSGGVSAPVLNELQHIQLTGDPAADDANFRAHILANAQAPAAAAGAVTPTTTLQDQGPVIQPFNVGARGLPDQGTATAAGAPIQKSLSPESATSPTQIGTTPQGAPIYGTRDQFIQKSGASPLGTGRPIPASLRGPNAPAPGVVTGVGPAQQAAMSTEGGNSANAFQRVTDQGTAARGQGAVLDNMLADTSQFTTGPGADLIQRLRQVGTRLGIPVDPNATSASESFNKLASQLADAQGAGSDARLAVNQAANPHNSLSPGGVDLILRQLRGNADYLQAQQHLAAGWGNPADYKGFQDKVGSNLDPRVFQYARMAPEQKATYFGSLKDKSTFKKAYGWATDNGLIGAPNATQ